MQMQWEQEQREHEQWEWEETERQEQEERDRNGNIDGAGKDGRKTEGDIAAGDGRTAEVGSCGDAAENGRDMETEGEDQDQDQEMGVGPSVPKKRKMEDKVSFCLNYNRN